MPQPGWFPETSGPGTAAADPGAAAMAVLAALERAGTGAVRGSVFLEWCADRLGARAEVVPPGGRLPAWAPGDVVAELDALASGRVPGPVQVPSGVVLAVGRRRPGSRERLSLLLVERDRAFTAEEIAALKQITIGLGVLAYMEEVSERDARLSAASAALRLSGLQQLMAGDLVRAGRTLEPLVPGLVAVGSGRVAIAECAPREDRGALAAEVEQVLKGRALIVLCPVSDRQVIIIYPAEVGAGGVLEQALGTVVDRMRGRSAGISAPTPWHGTAGAYETAVAALAEARGARPRLRVHDGRAPLPEQLSLDARMLSALILLPLRRLPRAQREDLVDVVGQTLWWGPEAGSRLVGWSADTLADRLAQISALTGLDPGDEWQRAALYLAVRHAALPEPPTLDPRVRLEDVLSHAAARRWAAQVLDPLKHLPSRSGGPTAIQVAVCWLRHGRRPEPVMAELGIGRSTVYRRLAQVSSATHLEVTQFWGHATELMLALAVAGHMPVGSLPPLARDLDGPRREGEPMVVGPEIDTGKPHPARMYDYYLGGRTNYKADRDAAQLVIDNVPEAVPAAVTNRAFINRAVRYLTAQGIDQFLDIGAGIPTSPNVHETAQRVNPAARVVYIDNDPIVLAHVGDLLASTPEGRTAYAQADVHAGTALFDLPEVRDNLDLDRPLGLFMFALLHFVPGDDAARLVREMTARLVPGSAFALSHVSPDFAPERTAWLVQSYRERGIPAEVRSKEGIEAILAGIPGGTLVDPGVVPPPEWRRDADDDPYPEGIPYQGYGAVVRIGTPSA
jgi:hypothetical protein